MEKDDGGPAFPRPISKVGTLDETDWGHVGMTLRDYFAAAALTGFLAAPEGVDDVGYDARMDAQRAATWSYEQADAMLKVRAAATPQEVENG